MAKCRSCGANIVWAIVKESGKRIPLDTPPVGNGSYEKVGEASDATFGTTMKVRPLGGDQLGLAELDPDLGHGLGERYMPHHATCPDAEEWRRGQ